MTAIRFEQTPAASAADRVGRAAAHILTATMRALAGWWRQRQAVRQLSAADDTMLRDIGLTRGGIESAIRHGRR